MNRTLQLQELEKTEKWDIVVIGGGACGLGIAIDAASRGYKTALFEKYDFSKGTSSRSTKLVHGGVRYLAQGDVGLVYEALKERGLLSKNAAHLVSKQPFIIPNYSKFDGFYYTSGLKVYDWMSRSLSLGKTEYLNEKETLEHLPTLQPKGLKSGVVYYDGQFDDARLAVNLAQTADENGANMLNYCGVEELIKGDKKGKIKGVVVKDYLSDKAYTVKSKVVINATGIFTDDILKLDGQKDSKTIVPSQGIHLVIDSHFLPGHNALMVPKTSDGRVLFAVPWHNKVIVGTTDTLRPESEIEPQPLKEEIDFVLTTLNEFLDKEIKPEDVTAVFAGLRPLAAPKEDGKGTKEISRGHKISLSDSGLVTISGGKWTTYRKIAADTLDKVIRAHKLKDSDCVTEELSIHGNVAKTSLDPNDSLAWYGSDANGIKTLENTRPELKEPIHENFPYTMAQVVWAVKHEMAMRVEDVLARRVRMLFLDAQASLDSAEKVAKCMAAELNKDKDWIRTEVEEFSQLASNYKLETYLK